jgi:drug/metabolite transporter (DMT)-like permease
MRASPQPDDGTRQLLQAGIYTLAAGVIAALLTVTVFGGISRQGPHTNSGWISLLIAMMCLPFGSMAFALGAAKWLRNRRVAASGLRTSAPPLDPMSSNTGTLLSFSEHSMEHRSHGKERQ